MTVSKYPCNYARILTTAFKMAMAITLALARDRATGKSRPLYFGKGKRIKGMANVWNKAKTAYQLTIQERRPDALLLLKVEHAIRRSFSRILLKTSVRYGNTETRRVKREEGEKGYLNILWDYAGSRIRDVVKSRFFFPKPISIEKSDGKSGIGYPGSAKTPIYPVRHNHLPELDFGDMIRSPLMELVRQSMKYGVPIKEAKKYIDDLLFRLIPFLDYIYTERRSGRSNYVRDGLKELRAVVDLLKRDYGTRNGQRQSITSEVQESVPFEDIIEGKTVLLDSDGITNEDQESTLPEEKSHFLQNAITAAIKDGAVLDDIIKDVQKLVDNETLTVEDSIELINQAKEQSRRIGSQLHRFVEKNFQSPFSLNGIVYHGTEMAYDGSGLILFSEVSVDGGRGRVDFVLARAKQLSRVDEASAPIVCEPILVADLKTKSAFDFDIYGMESRSKSAETVVSEFVLERRALTKQEWEMVLSNTPLRYEKEQIKAYETAITTDYENIMWKDSDRQEELNRAVIVVDSFQNWKDISEALLPLILQAYNGCVDETLSENDFLCPSDDASPRIALKMLSVVKPTTDTISLKTPISVSPFSWRVQDEKEFILYLTIPGSGSPAQSAAVIAERWHGLEHVYDLAKERRCDVYWFDLVGEYNDPVLRRKQFRLRYHKDPLKQFFKRRVRVKDLSDPIRKYIYDGVTIDTLRERIQDLIENSRNPIVVVSGWETLRRKIPDSLKKHLDEIAATIMQSFPNRCSILWFARPVPIAQSSTTYSTRCVAPFYQGTIWQNYVDAIIWNVVMPPDRTGARYPTNDHERGIFIERPGRPVIQQRIEIEPLKGWGEDFRSGGRKKQEVFLKGSGQSISQSIPYVEEQVSKCMGLIPHLLLKNQYNPRPLSNDSLGFKQVPLEEYQPQDLQPMLSYRPTQIYALEEDSHGFYETDAPKIEVDGRVKLLLPIEKINRRREYRQMELDVAPSDRSTRPPSEYYLQPKEIDDHWVSFREILNLKDSIRFLKQESSTRLMPLLEELSEIIDDVNRDSDDKNTAIVMRKLRLILKTLDKNTLSKDVWKRLFHMRSLIPRNLTKTQEKHITSLQKRNPDILHLTGNHLFLIILAALDQFPDTPFTETLHSQWEYVRPWHLTGLGFRPVYPKNHNRGRSVLDRHRLLQRLRQRITDQQSTLNLQSSLTNIKFGQLIALPHSAPDGSSYFWLLFQQRPGLFDMHAALVKSKWIEPHISPIKALREMVSDKTYWSESDLVSLSKYAKLEGNLHRVSVMIADQLGLQVLWVGDDEVQSWVPIGQVHYSTRRYEDVTLVRTITLTADPHLYAIDYENIREPIHQPKDMVERALFILHKELGGCVPAECKVTLDSKEKMYRVSFTGQGDRTNLGELLINRTVDLLEILRRPDNDCEPVIVKGNRLIWNRFEDISYEKDIALIRPWVNRRDPFPGMALKLPPSAIDLLDVHEEFDIKLEVDHDPWTCPMRDLSLEVIQRSQEQAKEQDTLRIPGYDRPEGEPERISNEPGVRHGSCWKILAKAEDISLIYGITERPLTPELEELMTVRLTDSQVRDLLSSQELVYQSRESKEWKIHPFALRAKEKCIKEIQESWRLLKLLKELEGIALSLTKTGAYLHIPDRWIPDISITPDSVVIGVKEKGGGRVESIELSEKNLALRPASDVRDFLEREMEMFLKKRGIVIDRRLNDAIQSEIEERLEIYHVDESGAEVELESVSIGYDSVGGRVIYVSFISGNETHKVPVTGHLHDYGRFRSVGKDEFVEEVESVLEEYNLCETATEEAVRVCVQLMRKEGLIKR